MYRDFHVHDRWTKKQVPCIYQALIVAVSTRHADATDIKFLVDGRPVWVALPLPAWDEYKKRAGKTITDPLAIAIAGHYLKTALESGEGVGAAIRASHLMGFKTVASDLNVSKTRGATPMMVNFSPLKRTSRPMTDGSAA